mmetsp:Transcript_10316/g.34121  ORF Transcript_10316/g.34121 Transcript_10316/m.34121 type:complete len:235 (+) Transcript_10316:391-1095(+)
MPPPPGDAVMAIGRPCVSPGPSGAARRSPISNPSPCFPSATPFSVTETCLLNPCSKELESFIRLPTKPLVALNNSPALFCPAEVVSFALLNISRAASRAACAVASGGPAAVPAPGTPFTFRLPNTPRISGDSESFTFTFLVVAKRALEALETRGSPTAGAIANARSMRWLMFSTGGNFCKRRNTVPKSSLARIFSRRKMTIATANASIKSRGVPLGSVSVSVFFSSFFFGFNSF